MSITAAHGWEACYQEKISDLNGEEKTFIGCQDVVAWQELSTGLIVGLISGDGKGKGICSAQSYANFMFYREKDEANVPIPAAPGFWIDWHDPKTGEVTFYSPVIAWVVSPSGWRLQAVGLPDGSGYNEPAEPSEHTRFVYDPTRRPFQFPAEGEVQA